MKIYLDGGKLMIQSLEPDPWPEEDLLKISLITTTIRTLKALLTKWKIVAIEIDDKLRDDIDVQLNSMQIVLRSGEQTDINRIIFPPPGRKALKDLIRELIQWNYTTCLH